LIEALHEAARREVERRMASRLRSAAWKLALREASSTFASSLKTAEGNMRDLNARSVTDLVTILLDERERSEKRSLAASALGGLRARSAVFPLLAAMDANEKSVCWAAAHALIEIQSKTATRHLIAAAVHAERTLSRLAAIYVLGSLCDTRGIDALLRIALSPTESVQARRVAIDALSLLGRKRRVLESLIFLTNDNDERIRYASLASLSTSLDRACVREAIHKRLSDAGQPDGCGSIGQLASSLLTGI
jgi:HEAT repeat protein